MENIYIGFSYPKKFKVGAAGIAMWQNRNYSHVFIRFESSKIPSSIYHAAHGMVHFREFNNFLNENNIVKEYQIPVISELRIKILTHCIFLSGEKYGYSELGKIVLSDIIYNITGQKITFGNGKGYICSELVGVVCRDEFGLQFKKPMNLLKPSDIDFALEGKYSRSV